MLCIVLTLGYIEGDASVGGIIGDVSTDGIVSNSHNLGNVVGDDDWIGGIAGGCFGTVEKCYNEGVVTLKSLGNNSSYDKNGGNIGGICGATGTNCVVTVRNNYNRGSVVVEREIVTGVGGIIGWISDTKASGNVYGNYNIGKIDIKVNKEVRRVGGVIGRVDNKAFIRNNNYYIEGAVGTLRNTEGEEKTETEMKSQSFVDLLNEGQEEIVWEINGQNDGYPVIKEE